MTVTRVSIPAAADLSWVVPVPELSVGESRPASPGELRRLEIAFAPPECPGCVRFVERAMEALALALDEYDEPDDEPPPGDLTD
jgi:hypothetical protein